jgi:hypothetical protein
VSACRVPFINYDCNRSPGGVLSGTPKLPMNRPEGKSFFQGAERGGRYFGKYRGFCAILPKVLALKPTVFHQTPPPHGTIPRGSGNADSSKLLTTFQGHAEAV